MEELGEFLGILAVVLFGAAVLNYLLKWANRQWIMKLPKESGVKKTYQQFLKFFVKNHRYFGFGVLAAIVLHLYVQITYRWLSITGIVAAGLLLIIVALGALMFWGKKEHRATLLKVHRGAVITMIVAVVVHAVSRL